MSRKYDCDQIQEFLNLKQDSNRDTKSIFEYCNSKVQRLSKG